MNRLERITAILLQLQSRRKVTAQQLALKFDTSIRTIYRDIRVLEEAGVPIGAEAGLGYYIMEGYQLPPVLFTKDEAGAMLTAEKLLSKFGDLSLYHEYNAAMDKVRAVLKAHDKEYLEILEDGIYVYSIRPQIDTSIFPNKYISNIQQALVNQCVLEIDYYSRYSDETNKRKIEPIGLAFINGSWHLFAWCRMRNAARDFRPDRIKKLTILNEHYHKQALPSLTQMAEQFLRPSELTQIVLHIKKGGEQYVDDLKMYLGLQKEADCGDYIEMEFLHPNLKAFAIWILHWGKRVKIIKPAALKKEVKRLSRELFEHHQQH